jgi:Protein of unknown function (DUF2815)
MAEAKAKKTRIVTARGRAFYANALMVPKANDQGVDKYSIQFLIPKNSPGVAPILAAVEEAKRAYETKFNGGKKLGEAWAMMQTPLRDGDAELASGKQTDRDYAGHLFFNASSTDKPGLVDKDVQEIVDPREIYSGMFVKIDVNFYPFANKTRGVAAGLNHVQKVGDGEPKSGAGSASGAFSRYEDNDQEEDPQW